MTSGSTGEQFPDWEWAYIQDMTNVPEMEGKVADPCSWNLLAQNQRACFLEASFRVNYRSIWVDDEHDETRVPWICAFPRPFRNGMWCCDVLVDIVPAHVLNPGQAAVLVREIPSRLVLTCRLSETAVDFNMMFSSLAGKEVGQKSFPKDDGGRNFSTQNVAYVAEELAYEQGLLASDNQKVCIVVEGLPYLVSDGTVLESG